MSSPSGVQAGMEDVALLKVDGLVRVDAEDWARLNVMVAQHDDAIAQLTKEIAELREQTATHPRTAAPRGDRLVLQPTLPEHTLQDSST